MTEIAYSERPGNRPRPVAMDRRASMLDKLASRFYFNEQGILVSNGLSTELIAFPSDNFSDHSRYVGSKIRHAMAYTSAFRDVEELNSLKFVARHGDNITPDDYTVLGLYLYMEDECSRLGKKESFLTALREVGARVNINENKIDRDKQYEKVKEALERLDMTKSHGHIIDSWYNDTSYSLYGDVHKGDGTRAHLMGTYAILAQDVSMHNPKLLGLNYSISYALGNRELMKGKTPEQAYDITRARLHRSNAAEIGKTIAAGDAIREANIKQAIKDQVPQPPEEYAQQIPGNKQRALDILSYLPNPVMKLLLEDRYMFAYTNSMNMENVYPAKDLPGVTVKDNIDARKGKALRQPRYHMIFLSNGDRVNPQDIENNDPLKNKIIAESILHESMHLVISHLSEEKVAELKKEVEAVHEELKTAKLPDYFNQHLETIDTNTLAQVADYESGLYPNYLHTITGTDHDGKEKVVVLSDTRWEEVACNILGMMYTEHSYEHRFNSPHNPYSDLPALGTLAADIKQLSDDVAVTNHVTAVGKRHTRWQASSLNRKQQGDAPAEAMALPA